MSQGPPAVRQRWDFLAECLRFAARPSAHQSAPSAHGTQASPVFGCSGRRLQSFDLFERESRPPEAQEEEDEEWDLVTYTASCSDSGARLRLDLRLCRQPPSFAELRAFNNTGNVCVWPSEECLAWSLLERGPAVCPDARVVLELGSGQAGLAGLVCALLWPGLDLVLLTDGNERCADNLAHVVALNADRFSARAVRTACLRWGSGENSASAALIGQLAGQCDLILCADCFFFEEGHAALVEAIARLLEPRHGRCLCVGPERAGSLERFRQAAARRLSVARRVEFFSRRVQERQAELEEEEHFDTDQHAPQMLLLSGSETSCYRN